MTPHEHNDLIAAYALGCLDPDELAPLQAHLAQCAACRAELAAYEAVVDALPLASPQIAPPAQLKQRLLARVTPPAAGSGWRARLAGGVRRARAQLSWQPVAAFAALLLLFAATWLWQSAQPPALPGTRLLLVSTTDAAPAAVGLIHISADGEYGTIIVEGLPGLGMERQYQLWLIADGARTDGGVFSVYSDGYASMAIRSPRPLSDYQAFGVTIEPAGGSPQPTGPRVLASQP